MAFLVAAFVEMTPRSPYSGRVHSSTREVFDIPDDAAPVVASAEPAARSLVARVAWVLGGLLCVAVGAVGVVVPGLPTTVFFIAAAACFSRSSPRLEAWVLSLPKIGAAVSDYRAGRGMSRSNKIVAIVMIAVFVSLSVVLVDALLLRVTLVVAGLVGIATVLRVRTKTEPDPDGDDPTAGPDVEPWSD